MKDNKEGSAGVHNTTSRDNGCCDPLHKTVKINQVELHGLIDTGSDVNLIKASAYIQIGTPKLEKSILELNGIGKQKVKTLGKFESEIEIDNIQILANIHVMPDDHLPTHIVIGKGILDKVTLTVNSKEAKFVMCQNQGNETLTVPNHTDENETNEEKIKDYRNEATTFLAMTTVNNDFELDVGDVKYEELIEDIVTSYSPRKTEDTLIKLKLILTDEEPVYQPPRRLAKIECDEVKRLVTNQRKDERLSLIFEILETKPYDNFVREKNLLFKEKDDRRLLVIPDAMQTEIVRQCHENGHFALTKTKELILRDYWFSQMDDKIKKFISNCVPCILAERKQGKQEGLLNPIEKGDAPLEVYHIDHLGPLSQTKKGYKYVFAVTDAFTKFVWIYPTKTTNTEEVLAKLRAQQIIFGNPKTIICDRGSAFRSDAFESYCEEEKIRLIKITTGIPRGNGQIERINRTIIPVLTKTSLENPEKWYTHVPRLQEALNTTFQRSIGRSPFELMFGIKARRKEDAKLREIIQEEFIRSFDEERNTFRDEAKKEIHKVQEENRRQYNKKRKPAKRYQIGDLVAIERTQFAPCAKICRKFLGPYKVIKKIGADRYEVEKVGSHIGPIRTQSAADRMKPWSSEADDFQDGRVWDGDIADEQATESTHDTRGRREAMKKWRESSIEKKEEGRKK